MLCYRIFTLLFYHTISTLITFVSSYEISDSISSITGVWGGQGFLNIDTNIFCPGKTQVTRTACDVRVPIVAVTQKWHLNARLLEGEETERDGDGSKTGGAV